MLVDGLRSMEVSALGDRRLMVRAGLALVLANARYWPTVAPLVRGQLAAGSDRARAIRDPTLQALAWRSCPRRASTPRSRRRSRRSHHGHTARTRVEAIVALEIIYDYLDGLTEQPTPHPLATAGGSLTSVHRRRHRIRPRTSRRLLPLPPTHHNDDGYLEELVATSPQTPLRRCPRRMPIAAVAQRAAVRCAEAQVRAHARPPHGNRPARRVGQTRGREHRARAGASISRAQRPPCSPCTH